MRSPIAVLVRIGSRRWLGRSGFRWNGSARIGYCRSILVIAIAVGMLLSPFAGMVRSQDLSGAKVKEAIERGKKYLKSMQQHDGHWDANQVGHNSGATSLAVLALINSGMTAQDPIVRRALQFLRDPRNTPIGATAENYQVSLLIMALAAAKEGAADRARIADLAKRLEDSQLKTKNIGSWGYFSKPGLIDGGDPSNTQFAILALREAVESGTVVSKETWERARSYWTRRQSGDGGWGYSVGESPTEHSVGSMTVAGVASLAICEQMIRTDEGVAADGTPPCCQTQQASAHLEKGIQWLARAFTVGHNPGGGHGSYLYYLYGLERAGRLSGRRFVGEHDWYREGAAHLVNLQNRADGHWDGEVHGGNNIGTSYALLFLSKGLAPVLVNKLKYGPRGEKGAEDWNRHPRDVRNLADNISGLRKWPKLLTTQEVDIAKAVKTDGVNALLQGSVLYITGEAAPEFSADELKILKEYLQEGGFILAMPTCKSPAFEAGFRSMLKQILPVGEGELKMLTGDHPIYRAEYALDPQGAPLYGVDFGCRTPVIYSPEDLGCLWDCWARLDPPGRNANLKLRIEQAMRIGTNIMAYATGREPPAKTDVPQKLAENADLDNIERGLIQVAQIKHDGTWNAAPRALRHLLLALNDKVGISASTKRIELPLADPNVFEYPLIYMHGRTTFSSSAADHKQLQQYLERGGVLFADSCCGSVAFDKSFREFLVASLPGHKLETIPVDHDLFSAKTGQDIRRVRRRVNEPGNAAAGGNVEVREGPPVLEGVMIDGRLAVIYSRYDISCALERQASGNCEGYLPEDAVKIATNVVLYSLIQDFNLNTDATKGNN